MFSVRRNSVDQINVKYMVCILLSTLSSHYTADEQLITNHRINMDKLDRFLIRVPITCVE